MSEWESGNEHFKFVEPKINVEKVKEHSLGHPISKFALGLLVVLVISLPVLSFLFASRELPGGLQLPSYIFGLSLLVLVPLLVIFYKKKGAEAQIRSKPIVGLMGASFSFYSMYTILFTMYLIRPLYQVDNNEYNADYVWLILLPVCYLHACVYIQFLALSKCRMRGKLYRLVVSYPSSIFFTTIVLSIPFYLFVPFVPDLIGSFLMLVPFLLGLLGIYQTLITRPANKWEVKEIYLRTSDSSNGEDDQLIGTATGVKNRVKRVSPKQQKLEEQEIVDFRQPLSIVQITDPHIGPMMSVERLTEICESTVKLNPDLVFLTGDFFTTESFNPENSLEISLAPLLKLPPGRLYACLGNHDYEEGCMEILEKALRSINCPLLVDQCVLVETRIGQIQILGFDYRKNARQEHISKVCAAYPPIPNIPRIGLLHDPGAFKFIPLDYGLLAFSGHTHGGLQGLVIEGVVSVTLVGITGMPDYGLWKNGSKNYLYVHAGQGCRSLLGTMVLRVGIPAEDSLLQVYFES